MKKLVAIAALSLVALGAQAQTYQLTSVTLANPFGAVNYGVAGTGFDSSAQMVVSGTSVTGDFGLWHDGTGPGATNAAVDYSGNWSTTLGSGVNIIKNSETCYDGNAPGGVVAAGPSRICGPGKGWADLNGWEGNWINGQNRQAGADARYVNTVSISGSNLIITSQSQFSDNPTSSFFNFPCPVGCSVITATYAQVVPVPAAVWLFGSAVGLMGWMRRRAQV